MDIVEISFRKTPALLGKRDTFQWLVVGGCAYPSEKYEFVSWDFEILKIWTFKKIHGSKPSSDLQDLNKQRTPVGYLWDMGT